ncbi:MAG: peptide-methionine (S)-S-oxide reductase MsrA [Spirochaetales bacterium]|nr:peptide-methionine (S)-S-oxide reductase MsrA [Spirochaetales bacterium]
MTDRNTAYFGGGCFWCLEAVFSRISGVEKVTSGYAGGHTQDPDYNSVCSGTTGHAEVVEIAYDPAVITYPELLGLFFVSHDPTTLNRQGADVGTQYRSIILTRGPGQEKEARAALKEASRRLKKPAVTEIIPLERFYPAEGYHQDYYARNPYAGYCRAVIAPKLEKLNLLR